MFHRLWVCDGPVVIAPAYLKTNRRQAELAEDHGTSQSTVSRAITGITPCLKNVLAEFMPTADELDPQSRYMVDGSPLSCWSWRSDSDLHSGKRKTIGMNVQFACTLEGELAWTSDPLPDSRHDSHCLRASGALGEFSADKWIGNKGYIGLGVITHQKPTNRQLPAGSRTSTRRSTKSYTSSSEPSRTSNLARDPHGPPSSTRCLY